MAEFRTGGNNRLVTHEAFFSQAGPAALGAAGGLILVTIAGGVRSPTSGAMLGTTERST